MEAIDIYMVTRTHILDLAREVGPTAMRTIVPSCPAWNATDVIAHLVSLPAAIGAGDLPTGDVDEWIERIRSDRADRTIDELADEWMMCDTTIESMMSGGGTLLCDDIVVHEHDLRGALGRHDRTLVDPDASVRGALAGCVGGLTERGLGAIEVRDGAASWVSHEAPVGWVIETTPWEAVRALFSRRTIGELRELGGSDDLDAYIAVIDDHLPLPVTSLGER